MKQSYGLINSLTLRREIAFSAPPAQHFVRLPLGNPHRLAPVDNAKRDAIYLYEYVLAFITGLLVIGGPSAIFWLVALIIVNPLDGMLGGRARPHVFKEVHKIDKPSVAYTDTATAISMVLFVIWIAASVLYRAPYVVLRGVAAAVSSGVLLFAQKCAGGFLRKASATLRGFSDVCGSSDSHVPAVAFAVPHNVAGADDFRTRHNKKAPEAFAGNIKGFWHLNSSVPNWKYTMDYGMMSN